VQIPIKARRDEKEVGGVGLLPSRTCTRCAHTYTPGLDAVCPDWPRRSRTRPVPPILLRLVQSRHNQSQQDRTGAVGARRDVTGRVGGTRPDVAHPVQTLTCVYASLSKDLAPILYRVLAASAWSNYSTIQQLKVRSQ